MQDKVFFDTSVLVYAFDESETEKHGIALKLVKDNVSDSTAVISSQVLLELYNVLTRFVSNPISNKEAASIISDFINASDWEKLDYNIDIVNKAIETAMNSKISVWDSMIAETMKESGVFRILTENEKDFGRIKGIVVVNPFKK